MYLSGLQVFIGYDSTEDAAAMVCAQSLREHTSIPLAISFLRQDWLREKGFYTRDEKGDPVSTEFAYTRFLVPLLCGFQGYALFVDCDFLFTRDIGELVELIDGSKAVSVVKHPDYEPKRTTKMDGKSQKAYPRKNWSSLMFFNCAHQDTRLLTKYRVNMSTGGFLHRLVWAEDKNIGEIPREWNWLVGEYEDTEAGLPAGIHFTNGGPWHEHHRNEDWGYLWDAKFLEMEKWGGNIK